MTSSYTNYHLVIAKERFERMRMAGKYKEMQKNLTIEGVKPSIDTFMLLLNGVGQNWGWQRRPKYQDNNAIKLRLDEPKTELMILKNKKIIIGYCLVSPPNKDLGYKDCIEIENFGFFLNQTKKGFGKVFLPEIFARLFQNYRNIYLTSRSTNHDKVINFYTNLGMEIIKTEINPDDLIYTDVLNDAKKA